MWELRFPEQELTRPAPNCHVVLASNAFLAAEARKNCCRDKEWTHHSNALKENQQFVTLRRRGMIQIFNNIHICYVRISQPMQMYLHQSSVELCSLSIPITLLFFCCFFHLRKMVMNFCQKCRLDLDAEKYEEGCIPAKARIEAWWRLNTPVEWVAIGSNNRLSFFFWCQAFTKPMLTYH